MSGRKFLFWSGLTLVATLAVAIPALGSLANSMAARLQERTVWMRTVIRATPTMRPVLRGSPAAGLAWDHYRLAMAAWDGGQEKR